MKIGWRISRRPASPWPAPGHTPVFFGSGDWLGAVSSQRIPDERPVVLVVKEKGNAIAVLPLVSTANILGGRDLCYLGAAFYPDPFGHKWIKC